MWGLGLLAFECQLVPGLRKRFDIYLVHWNVAVEVDGQQHFEGSYYGTPAAVQYEWDRQVDAACERVGQRLVRLHWADRHEWAITVATTLANQKLVTYTSSYGL
jgi:very-short-patch-repair endonuclease